MRGRLTSSAIPTSGLLAELTPSARTNTSRPSFKRSRLVWRTQMCDCTRENSPREVTIGQSPLRGLTALVPTGNSHQPGPLRLSYSLRFLPGSRSSCPTPSDCRPLGAAPSRTLSWRVANTKAAAWAGGCRVRAERSGPGLEQRRESESDRARTVVRKRLSARLAFGVLLSYHNRNAQDPSCLHLRRAKH